MSEETYVVVGWPSCRYYQQAVQQLKQKGKKVIVLDEKQVGPILCKELSTWSGNGGSGWRSPHIFKYIGGSADLNKYLSMPNSSLPQGCREILGRVIC